jgi:putative copper resistance protein D
MKLPPLTPGRGVTSWDLDLPTVVLLAVAVLTYLARGRQRSARNLTMTGLGVLGLLIVTCSFLGVYDHTLFWVLAVQDVLLLTLVPIPLVMAGSRTWRLSPLAGSVLATGTLTAIYVSGWDQARLQHAWLFAFTHLLLVGVGCLFLGPLLQEHGGSFAARALVGFVDGLLDAIPGLAVLATHGVIASGWYSKHGRSWGPSALTDQQIGGTAMIALSELVGLPALVLLLTRWMRADAVEADRVDAHLDQASEGLLAVGDDEQRPWWEQDAGPLADRARRHGWTDDPPP